MLLDVLIHHDSKRLRVKSHLTQDSHNHIPFLEGPEKRLQFDSVQDGGGGTNFVISSVRSDGTIIGRRDRSFPPAQSSA